MRKSVERAATVGVTAAVMAAGFGLGTISHSSTGTTAAIAAPASESLTIQCPNSGETWNKTGFPLVVQCPGNASVIFQSNSVSPPPPTTTTTVASTTTTTIPASGYLTPPASLMPDSIFNQPVTGWSVASDSAQLVTNFVGTGSAGGGYTNNYGSVGVSTQPGYWVPTGQTDVSFSQTPSADGCTAGPFVGTDPGYIPTEVPIPSFAALNGSGDNPLDVWSANGVYEIWQANQLSSLAWEGCYGGYGPMSTFTGVFAGNKGRTATSISDVATMVTEADVASGSIDHAISVQITDGNGWVLPATRGDFGSDPGEPAEGQYFRFAPGTTCSEGTGIKCNTPYAQMVFNAIQKYGMVVSDQAGAYQINQEAPADWANEGEPGTDPITKSWCTDWNSGANSCAGTEEQEYNVISGLPWNDLQVLNYP